LRRSHKNQKLKGKKERTLNDHREMAPKARIFQWKFLMQKKELREGKEIQEISDKKRRTTKLGEAIISSFSLVSPHPAEKSSSKKVGRRKGESDKKR